MESSPSLAKPMSERGVVGADYTTWAQDENSGIASGIVKDLEVWYTQ
jgi:hypothetical protein